MYSHEFYDIGYREGRFQYDNCVTKELVIEYWHKGKTLQFSITDYKYFDCIYAEDIRLDTMSDVDNPTNQEILELYSRLIN